MEQWVELFMGCADVVQGSIVQRCWPDGRSLLEQPALTVAMFALVREQLQAVIQKELEGLSHG